MPQTTFSRHMKVVSHGRRCNTSRSEGRGDLKGQSASGGRGRPKVGIERGKIDMATHAKKRHDSYADQEGFLWFYVPMSDMKNKLNRKQRDDVSTQSFFSAVQNEGSTNDGLLDQNGSRNINKNTQFSETSLESALATLLSDTNLEKQQDSVCSSIQQNSLNTATINSEIYVSRFNGSNDSPSLALTSVTNTPTSILTPSQSFTQESYLLSQASNTYSVPLASTPSRGRDQKKSLQRIPSGSSMSSANWGQFVDVAAVEEELEKYSRILNRK